MSAPEINTANTAEQAGDESLAAVFAAIDERRNFKLEAGAGAGKTHSLIQALKRILARRDVYLPRVDQRIACLTYTKVARNEIIERTDESPFVFADTLHGFLWEMISPFQKSLHNSLQQSDVWANVLKEKGSIAELRIDYDLGIRRITEDKISLHHDDIPVFAKELFGNPKFRALITDRFPIIFIDEYQDTPAGLAEAMLPDDGDKNRSPVLGFFGDHWQQIYDRTCGSIEHPTLASIPKNANFRSDRSIVSFLNQLRPELPQTPAADAAQGSVTIYHTNEWPGTLQKGQWKDQISHEATQACLAWLKQEVSFGAPSQPEVTSKVLMLTHTTIASELGYPTLPKVFKRNDSFVSKEDAVIEFLIDTLEPALEAFDRCRFGNLFDLLGGRRPILKSPKDKAEWNGLFQKLISMSESGTVGDMLDLLDQQSLFALPTRVEVREQELKEELARLTESEELEEPRKLVEHWNLRKVAYSEIRALSKYLSDDTDFSTKHSVKGAQFDDVIVVLGRGWNIYNFPKMVLNYPLRNNLSGKERTSFERSRNLFYVAASRAKHNLTLLFVQRLDEDEGALDTLAGWVGEDNVVPISFQDETTPISSSRR